MAPRPERSPGGHQAPISDDTKTRILELHAAGETRNAIARQLDVSGSTVSKVVTAAGLTFERGDQVKAATEARKADLAKRRADLREKFLTRADELLDMFDKPVTVFNFGGRDNTYAERTLDKPTISDMRSLVQAAATASTQEIRIAQAETGANVEAAKSLLTGLAEALGVKGPPAEQADEDPASE